jgi:hypothetical protein
MTFKSFPLNSSHLTTGSLLFWKNPQMTKKDGTTPFHYSLLLKTSSNGKYLLLPLTSTGYMDQSWSLDQDSSMEYYLPSPFNLGKGSGSSPNLMMWFTYDEMMEMGMNETMFFLSKMTDSWMETFMKGFMYDLYQNLPSLPYDLYWYKKFQKTFESDGSFQSEWTSKKWNSNKYQWKTYGTFKKY